MITTLPTRQNTTSLEGVIKMERRKADEAENALVALAFPPPRPALVAKEERSKSEF